MSTLVEHGSPMEDTLHELSTDELTGFYTRSSLFELISRHQKSNPSTSIAIIALELSRFGIVNDSVGTTVGDKIIQMVANRFKKLFPNATAIARLHGDHFGIMFENCLCIDDEVNRLFEFSQRPMVIMGEVIVLSVRVGIAVSDELETIDGDIMHAAEVALHHCKASGSKQAYFDLSMIQTAKAVHRLENDLRVSLVTNALELFKAYTNSEFVLQYQPIVESSSGNVHAFEALLRWHHPERGVLSPAMFIPLAEQIQVMTVLGNWIIRKACADAIEWPRNGDGSEISVSINVSPAQFYESETLIRTIKSAIDETGIEPGRLKFEVTESLDFAATLKGHLKKIRDLGCKVSLDDFGTGYSSIAQLNELPLDYVKIDRSLVKDLSNQDQELAVRSTRLAKAVLNLGASLELTPIVEGVESKEVIEMVNQLGGDLIQGYAYSTPINANEIKDCVKRINLQ